MNYNIEKCLILQIYLLAAAPSKSLTAVFRFHLNLLNGPLLAFLFPETDSRIVRFCKIFIHFNVIFCSFLAIVTSRSVYLLDSTWNDVRSALLSIKTRRYVTTCAEKFFF